MDASRLDGNSVAGLLHEIFGTDMTPALGTCGNCGVDEPLGAMHAYRSAGVVLRCPHCNHMLVKIVDSETATWISSTGVRTLRIPKQEA
ncbi:MAG TPA: DUF6510 family protein [Gaiellaceae bacterium]|nr:DUF6510 family protein [Gaiellaceae bacterium]